MPSYAAAGLGQALGQAAPQFTQALARIGQMRRQRKLDREERERYHNKVRRDRTKMRLEAVQTPGVSVGEPEGPMTSAMQRIGAVGDTPLYYQEPEPETPTYNVSGLGVDLPMTDEGIQKGIALRRRMGLIDGGGGGSDHPGKPTFGQALDFTQGATARRNEEGYVTGYGLPPADRYRTAMGLAQGDTTALSRLEGMGGQTQPQGGGDQDLVFRDGKWLRQNELGIPVEVTPEERPDLYRDEKRELFGVDWLAPDKTVAVPPSDTARVRRQRERGRLTGSEGEQGGGAPGLKPSAEAQGRQAESGRPRDANGVAIDLMQRAGSAEAALRRIEGQLGDQEPTPQEQRVIDALRDYAATGD